MEQRIKLISGDILICQGRLPLIQHYGVLIVEGTTECVYHCTPSRNVICDTLSDFLKEYKLTEIKRTNAINKSMYARYQECRHKGYDVISFNCIQFAEFLTTP